MYEAVYIEAAVFGTTAVLFHNPAKVVDPVSLRTAHLRPLHFYEINGHSFRFADRGLYGRLIPRDAMDLKQARAVDLRNDASYRGLWRTNGIGMPGYSEGWFRLKGGEKALMFLTDPTRAVTIPTNLGYSVLISPADPENLLAALRE